MRRFAGGLYTTRESGLLPAAGTPPVARSLRWTSTHGPALPWLAPCGVASTMNVVNTGIEPVCAIAACG